MKNLRRVILIVILLVVLAAVGLAGYHYWYQPAFVFFNTTDATVTGSFVRVAAPATGQINDILDAGASVNKGDALATIKVVSTAPSAASGPSVSRLLTRVTSPITGTLSVRNVSIGETIAAGQSVASIVDLTQLWVIVNVEESRVADVRIGQTADVELGDVNRTFRGTVADIGSATTNVASPSISLNSSSDTTQKVPVKILFDYTGARLVPGMSATVTIYTNGAP